MARFFIHLAFRLPAERLPVLQAFLAEAIPYYERPGGIRVHLQIADPPGDTLGCLEVVEYADQATFEADQHRVENDPEMIARLAAWRAIVGPVEVSVWRAC